MEVEPGQWAPRSIRIESKDDFTCEYRFQLVAGKHWMLKEVVSWFKPEEKSRGVIEDVRIDGDREPLDDALRQVQAARALFGGAGEPDRRVNVATVPFVLGRATRLGPYEVRVAMQDRPDGRRLRVDGRSDGARHGPRLLPGREGPAPLRPVRHARRSRPGAAGLGRDPRLASPGRPVRSIVVPPGDAAAARRPIAVVPLRWGEPIAVNIPDARQGSMPELRQEGTAERPHAGLPGSRRNGTADGTAKLTLDVVSIDGMHEFYLDLAAALLGEVGRGDRVRAVSRPTLTVESRPVEKRFEIAWARSARAPSRRSSRSASPPAMSSSAPMGSLWGTFMRHRGRLRRRRPPGLARRGLAADRPGDTGHAGRRTERSIPSSSATGSTSGSSATAPTHATRCCGRWPVARADRARAGPGRRARRRGPVPRLLRGGRGGRGLRPLAGDGDPQVREAAAIGLTFLGQADHLERLRSILSRIRPSEPRRAAVADLRASRRTRSSPWPTSTRTRPSTSWARRSWATSRACGSQSTGRHCPAGPSRGPARSGRRDLQAARPHGQPPRRPLADRGRRPDRRDDPTWPSTSRAMSWPTSMLRVPGPDEGPHRRASWRRATRPRPGLTSCATPRPGLPAGHPRAAPPQDVTDYAKYSAVQYLWNLGTPQAVDALREAYDRGVMKSEPWFWLRLCEALAACGDGRGLPDAFEVLLDLERPAEPPADEQKRRDWESDRDRRKDEAEAVFDRAIEGGPRRVPRPQGRRRLARRAAGRPPAPLAAARLAEAVRGRRPGLGEEPRPEGRRDGQAAAQPQLALCVKLVGTLPAFLG